MLENELRLGNFLKTISREVEEKPGAISFKIPNENEQSIKEFCEVEGVTNDGFIFSNGYRVGYYSDSDDFEPIQLNQKWLLDFGFKRYVFVDKSTQFRLKDRLIVYRNGFLHDYGTSMKIEYVHQLQNLYFALTGEELIYKK